MAPIKGEGRLDAMPVELLNGEQLYYSVHGEGVPIVWCHGGGSHHLVWWQQVPFFTQQGYMNVIWDQRGCGFSGGAQSGTAGARAPESIFWDDTRALMDHLKLEKAFIVGHSMGGRNVSGMAFNYPERMLGGVMAGSTFGFFTEAQKRWGAEMYQKLSAGEDVVTNSRRNAQGQRYAKEQPEMAFLREQLAGLFTPRIGVRGLDSYKQMAEAKPGDYSKFKIPLLFIVAEEDALQFPWLVDATAAAVAGSKLVHIPRAGHTLQWEESELFNRHLLEFFKSVKAE